MIEFLNLAAKVSKEYPVVVSEFLQGAKEIEFDAVAMNGEVVEYAISEHIEFAGVHSGDATLVFPAQKIYFETARRIKKVSKMIAKELNISGPFNIQFLCIPQLPVRIQSSETQLYRNGYPYHARCSLHQTGQERIRHRLDRREGFAVLIRPSTQG